MKKELFIKHVDDFSYDVYFKSYKTYLIDYFEVEESICYWCVCPIINGCINPPVFCGGTFDEVEFGFFAGQLNAKLIYV